MDFSTFQTVCQMLKRMPGYESSGGKSLEEITKAESILGIPFSQQCRSFFQIYDYVEFDGGEIFGIQNGASASVLEGNLVAYALHDRKHYHLPCQWLPVYNFYDGSLAYFDYSSLNENKEPRIIRAYYSADKQAFEIIEVLADDFGEFLFLIIKLHS